MENAPLSKRTVGFGLAVAIACIVNAIVVVAKEKSEAVMNAMKSILGHHWTTQAVVVIGLFFLLGGLFTALRGRGSASSEGRLIGMLVACVAIAGTTIVGFYLFAD
jgi:hypothetical protein